MKIKDPLSPAEKKRVRRRRVRRFIGLVLFIGAIVAGTWAFRMTTALSKGGSSIIDVYQGIADPYGQFPGKDRVLVLFVGKDYNHDRRGIAYTTDARADTILLISADLRNHKLAALSIPRDTRVTAPDGLTGKINATFQRGGVKLLEDTIESEFGVRPDHHVVLKADAVREIVNAVGGVDVEAIDDMFYEDSWADLKIDIKKGQHHLSGEEAVGYVRFRKSGTHRIGPDGEKIQIRHVNSMEEGDIRRTERQQALLRSIAAQATLPANFLNAPHVVDVAFGQVETDLKRTQVLALGTIFRKSGTGEMGGSAIPGEDAKIGGLYYWVPDTAKARLTINWLLLGDELSGKQLTRVSVFNGTATKGMALAVAKELTTEGFTAASGGNLPQKLSTTEVLYRKAAYEPFARQIAERIGAKVVKKDTGNPSAYWLPEIKVHLGADHSVPTPDPSSG